tara:strand:- start:2 stop:568 length:567 start_codon:yes stop_codon:yes gene_type:complete
MSTLATFVFKPRYPVEMTGLILESFTQHWLGWCDSGVHIYWRKDAPDGYVKFDVETEGGTEYYSETCFREDLVESCDLTDSMFVLLDQAGFFDAEWLNENWDTEEMQEDERVSGLGTETPKFYSFFERELDEVVRHLCEDGSRMMSFWSDKVHVVDLETPKSFKAKNVSLTEHVLKMDFPSEAGGLSC